MIRPAPGGETRRAETAQAGSVHEHPVAVGEAPDLKPLQDQIQSLSTALAESKRRAKELAQAAYGVDATAPSEAQMERLHRLASLIFNSTQETSHVEG